MYNLSAAAMYLLAVIGPASNRQTCPQQNQHNTAMGSPSGVLSTELGNFLCKSLGSPSGVNSCAACEQLGMYLLLLENWENAWILEYREPA